MMTSETRSLPATRGTYLNDLISFHIISRSTHLSIKFLKNHNQQLNSLHLLSTHRCSPPASRNPQGQRAPHALLGGPFLGHREPGDQPGVSVSQDMPKT